jgi:ComF family protein
VRPRPCFYRFLPGQSRCVSINANIPRLANAVAFLRSSPVANSMLILRHALDALASVFFPAPCRICGETLTNASRIPICPLCLDSFTRVTRPMCLCCGRPFVSPVAEQAIRPLCRLCRGQQYAFERARTFAIYDDAIGAAIQLLKYDQVIRLGDWFAARLAEVVAQPGDEIHADVVVPVPLHPSRQKERGYNQAELIARPLARRLRLPLGSYLLVRTKPRPAQFLLTRRQRWESVRGAYATRAGVQVDKLRILLVDDVMTTGATLDSCSRALLKAGAAAVIGLTVARVVSGWAVSGFPQRGIASNEANQQGAASILSRKG